MNVTRYTPVAMGLHWLIAFIILATLSLGLYMSDLPLSPTKLRYYSWHKWAGVTVFLLVVVRALWRFTHVPPPTNAAMPSWQHALARYGHGALYVLMFAISITGWLMSSAKGFQTVYFGVIPLPDLLDKNKELGEFLNLVHKALNYALVVVLAGHIAAALKHHLLDKDDILLRMLPGKNP